MGNKPGRRSKKRPPKKRTERRPTQREAVTITYEHIAPVLTAELDRRGGLAWERRTEVQHIIEEVLAGKAAARIRITADMAATVAACSPTDGANYTRERGANLAAGKTMPAADGTFDIAISYEMFFSFQAEPRADIEDKTGQLYHLAAHEPQHVLQHVTGTAAEDYRDDIECERTARAYRVPIAEALEEFRCELAASRRYPNQPTRGSVVAQDLDHMRRELTRAVPLIATDIRQALNITMIAAKEMVKALAYLAAEQIAADEDGSEPFPKPAGWDRYMSSYWPDFVDIVRSVPAADEPATKLELTAALTRLCIRTAQWLDDIGIHYTNSEDGESCYWDHDDW